MTILNLHHLGVPCISSIREYPTAEMMEKVSALDLKTLQVSDKTILRLEPEGGVITSPGLYASFMWADSVTLDRLRTGNLFQINLEDIALLHETGVIRADQQKQGSVNSFSVNCGGLPNQVLFEVTSECQCGCAQCYHKLDINRGRSPLKNLIQRVDKLSELGLTLFEVTGGEPLLCTDLGEILKRIKENGRNFYLVTNGGLLKNCRDSLIDLLKTGEGIALSIDGFGKHHDQIRAKEGLFRDIEEGLRKFRGSGIPFYFITTLGDHNYQDIPLLLDWASENNAKLHLRPVIQTGNALTKGLTATGIPILLKDYLAHPAAKNGFIATKKTIPESKYYGCGIRKRISVDTFGSLFPCVMDRSSRKDNLEAYTPEALVSDLRAETKRYLNYNPHCINCKVNANGIVCGGFCRFSNSFKNATTTQL
jgi:radical SAM protein with 4Fe4S-binding SPASM domain